MRVILSSFLSYAEYDCSRGAIGAAGAGAGGGDVGPEENKETGVADTAGTGADEEAVGADVAPKRPRISSTELFAGAAGTDDEVEAGPDPKISARRSWLF